MEKIDQVHMYKVQIKEITEVQIYKNKNTLHMTDGVKDMVHYVTQRGRSLFLYIVKR